LGQASMRFFIIDAIWSLSCPILDESSMPGVVKVVSRVN
jgi:hypothetical protein